MPALLLYLLQVNVGLGLLYLLYQAALRQTTFYTWNRWFLLVGLGLATGFPLVGFSGLLPEKPQLYQTISRYSSNWQPLEVPSSADAAFDVWQIPVAVFWLGLGVMAARFCVQLASLYSIHRRSRPSSFQGIPFREVRQSLPPFSFGNTIYFNSQRHPQEDWLPILRHEYTHVRQGHTLDILLVEFVTLVHWFNPVVWLLRKALKQNLEFLTDQQTVAAGIDRKRYQFSLLQTAGASPFSLSASFSYHSLKHRIMMMNKTPSARVQRLRFLAATPLLFVSLLACHTIVEPSPPLMTESTAAKEGFLDPQEQYKAFLLKYQKVMKLTWYPDTLMLHLVSGETEKYPRTPQGMAAAQKKYPNLPTEPMFPPPPEEAALAPPPPPPPVNIDLPEEFQKRNPTVKGLSVSEGSLYVVFKDGEVESFDTTPAGLTAFEKKYGPMPPPPPPVRKTSK
ncbi:M56 family metallopeptidase [Rufibacter sp. XAAS-G3-1]|uniref:M56 family metallopeptidase n=1 Tax=Rufibacter sp. XAAS-G3-1 TaxID=2729134 RepID=UPI0015E7A14B|nr:M56 family metallopeptidase [Rufibacter sp. XAAS-G3-1]